MALSVGPQHRADNRGDHYGTTNDNNGQLPLQLLCVDRPRLGESVPLRVNAEIVLDLGGLSGRLWEEWEVVNKHNNLFLVGIDASIMMGAPVS